MNGLLLMAYGTPEHVDDLEAYYTDIRRGRPPTAEQLADLRRRYDAIGGLSPLAERTRAQARALQHELGDEWVVELGLKHADPKIEQGARRLLEAGVTRIVGLVLAPHYSALSVGQYHDRAEAVVGDRVPYTAIKRWDHVVTRLLAERVLDAASRIAEPKRVETLFTAHSLPERALELDDPTYPQQLEDTARAVARLAKLSSYRVAWQSAGRTPEPWIGPDILSVLPSLPDRGFAGVVVCPAGFTSDHLEVLYDIDIEANSLAESLGLQLERTESLNDDPEFIDALARFIT